MGVSGLKYFEIARLAGVIWVRLYLGNFFFVSAGEHMRDLSF